MNCASASGRIIARAAAPALDVVASVTSSPSCPSPARAAGRPVAPGTRLPARPGPVVTPGGVIVPLERYRQVGPDSGRPGRSSTVTSGNRLERSFSYSDWMLPGPRGAQRVQPNVILAVLSLAALTYAILSSAVIPALTTIQHSLHASETGITWLLTGFLLSASVGTAIIGKLGDMYGKQRLLVWTLLILAAGTLLAALADSLPVLIVGRIVQGVAGGIFPLAFAS